MLGAVPQPSAEAQCSTLSKRTGKRCKRYSQAGSSVCSKHASSVAQASRDLLGAGSFRIAKPSSWEREWFGEPTTHDARLTRFDIADSWLNHEADPGVKEHAYAILDQADDLRPEDIGKLAVWLHDVLYGLADYVAEQQAAASPPT